MCVFQCVFLNIVCLGVFVLVSVGVFACVFVCVPVCIFVLTFPSVRVIFYVRLCVCVCL